MNAQFVVNFLVIAILCIIISKTIMFKILPNIQYFSMSFVCNKTAVYRILTRSLNCLYISE